jgi:hypothetical protein
MQQFQKSPEERAALKKAKAFYSSFKKMKTQFGQSRANLVAHIMKSKVPNWNVVLHV